MEVIIMTNSKLVNAFKLHGKVTVYVPSTLNVNEEIDSTVYVDRVASNLSIWFGGATSTPALGYWQSTEKGLVKERTTLVFAYCDTESLDQHIEELVELCETLKEEMKQEAVALEINGELYFI
jgi:hypothetical protein